jgi:hypothetical protein
MSRELDRLLHLDVSSRGVLCDGDTAYAHRRLEDLVLLIRSLDHVQRANIFIDLTDDARTCVEGLIEIDGHLLVAHGEATAVRVAVDIVMVRLLRQLADAGS